MKYLNDISKDCVGKVCKSDWWNELWVSKIELDIIRYY